MARHTLKFKVGLYLTLALSLATLAFIAAVGWYQRAQLLDQAADHVGQVATLIAKSTRYAMLQNQPYYVDRIIRDIAEQRSLERVRVLGRDGSIIQSSADDEVGSIIDRAHEGCAQCHAAGARDAGASFDRPTSDRTTWTFTNALGRRMLGSVEVIRNEPSCATASCHYHSPDTPVLGVLNIVSSLEPIDRSMTTRTAAVAALALGFVIVASLLVALFVHRLVYVPLRDLQTGAGRVSSGNMEEPIPVRSADEFGELAASFNAMTTVLRHSRQELREWGATLEQKVAERTEELAKIRATTMRGEKLASLGLLASGIAHELNNPLTGILTFSHLVRQNLPAGSAEAEDLDLVIRETKRCAAIIKRLLDFARDKPPEKTFADVNAIVEETVRIIERPASLAQIDVGLDLERPLPAIWVDVDQIKQVVMNMLVNAQHAIEGTGTITIRTRRLAEPKAPDPDAPAIPMVEIAISDTGCGIPDGNLTRIFDPFFTTKEVGKGTGLGLSVSHGIVKAHGGAIEVDSRVGAGTTFRIQLPLEPPADAIIEGNRRSAS